jgi:hypothetical protein
VRVAATALLLLRPAHVLFVNAKSIHFDSFFFCRTFFLTGSPGFFFTVL